MSIFKYIVGVCCLLVGFSLYSQQYQFKKYDLDDGLCHRFIYSIIQDKKGCMWLGTGEGLCRFDGLEFYSSFPGDTISNTNITCSFKDENDNVWFGHNDGQISFFDGEKLKDIDTVNRLTSKINKITADPDGNVFALSQNSGILKIDRDGAITHYQEKLSDNIFYSFIALSSKEFLCGTDEGMFIYNIEKTSFEKVSAFPEYAVTSIIKTRNKKGYLVATNGEGIFSLQLEKGTFKVDSLPASLGIKQANIQDVVEDSRHNLWICTFGSGVYKILYSEEKKDYSGQIHFNEYNGMISQYVKSVFEDNQGNIWFGTYGNGLLKMLNDAFLFYHFDEPAIKNNILSVIETEDAFWIGGMKGLLKVENHTKKVYAFANGLPEDAVTSLFYREGNTLWVGTQNSGLYQFDMKTERARNVFFSRNSLDNSIQDIEGLGDTLWLATKNGIIKYHIRQGVLKHYTTIEGLPHNNIYSLFLDEQGVLYYATNSNGIYSLNRKSNINIEANVELEFTCITKDRSGYLWAGSYGNGIFKFLNDSIINITSKDGLKSDFCYSITADQQGSIWVGHRLGMSRLNVFNESIEQYDQKKGFKGDCNFNSLYNNNKGLLYWGTNEGLVIYNQKKDVKNNIPPLTSITSININDVEYPVGELIKLPYGIYKLRISYKGINFTAPDKVKYQYKLEGFDPEWSEVTSENTARYNRLEDGKYAFYLMSFNEEGISDNTIVDIRIIIAKPLWKKWWFYVILAALVFFLIKRYIDYRIRKQKAFQEYLQELLDERTQEVRAQKEELEQKNKDITDSIYYARRIQSSMLPSVKKLNERFPESFVFYKPRDIVSGDFFWFSDFKKDKFILFCVDCTGHGVPGALVSMIGVTLLKDIIQRPSVNSPAEVLKALETDFQNTLNQGQSALANDGMDISVCEIDPGSLKVKISSAMRPVIIQTKDNLQVIRGVKMPIGGIHQKIKEGKEFEDVELQLSKGDAVFMFSDGIVDQFGGPDDTKFMLWRLKELLLKIRNKSMTEQLIMIRKDFENWKKNFRQIDDVLMMGIRL